MSDDPGFAINVVYGDGEIDIYDDNVDVSVTFADGRRFGATLLRPRISRDYSGKMRRRVNMVEDFISGHQNLWS